MNHYLDIKIRSFLAGCLIILFSSLIYAEEVVNLNLDDCLKMAFKGSYEIEFANNNILLGKIKHREARLKRLPTTSLTLLDNRVFDIDGFNDYDPETGQQYTANEGYEFSIRVDAPIYTWDKISSEIQYEKHNHRIKELEYSTVKKNLWLEVVSTYMSCLEKQSEQDVRREQVLKAMESLKLAEQHVISGKGIRYEILSEKAYLSEARLELLKTENALKDSKKELLFLIRKPLELNISFEDIQIPEVIKADLSDLFQTAYENREDIRKLQAEIAVIAESLDIIKASKRPNLNLFAQYSRQGSKWSSYSDDENQWVAGLSINFSPFNNSTLSALSSRNRIESEDYMHQNSLSLTFLDHSSSHPEQFELKIRLLRLQSEISQIKSVIEISVTKAYERQNESWLSCETEQYKLEAAEENYAIQKKRNELGMNQYNDLVDARTEVISSRINLYFAKYAYILSQAQLEHALGLEKWRKQYESK